jgi:EAL domain-containing protein (putative c-di-GMP-specific phosphodiesterase class I)/FixJ family two-component response regulator
VSSTVSDDEQAAGIPGARVLIVDDEQMLLETYARVLDHAGYRVHRAANGLDAIAALNAGPFDAIVTDITMPGLNGIQMLRAVRARDLDVPVIVNTGNPSVETAAEAMEFGALRYLVKPVERQVFVKTVQEAVRLGRLARLKRETAAYLGIVDQQLGDRAGLEVSLERALQTLRMAYQPIVEPANRRTVGFEALVRTGELALPTPAALFAAAEQLDRVHEVGRAIRHSVADTLRGRTTNGDIFVNLHPDDLQDDNLFAEQSPLAAFARSVVLEITERSPLKEGAGVPDRIRRLKQIGYRIAIDDLGSGYAGLNYFALLSPDVVKLDTALVRNISAEPVKQKLLGSMTELCKDLGIAVIAEGVETSAERDTIDGLGCELMQGYLFARPGPSFPAVRW